MRIKVMPLSSMCRYTLPVYSEGKDGCAVLLREEYCYLPRGHLGEHRGPSGAVFANVPGYMEQIERGRL